MTHKPSSTTKSTVVADDGAGTGDNVSTTSNSSARLSTRFIVHAVKILFFDSVKSTTFLLARSFSSRESQHPIPAGSLAVRRAGVNNTTDDLPPPSLKDPQMSFKDRLGKLRLHACGKVRQWSSKLGLIAFLCKKINRTGTGEDEEVDEMAAFAPVLGRLRLDALPEHASSIRISELLQDSENSIQSITEACDASQITIESSPLFGAYNILFPIRFADGAKWILKIPAAGGSENRWDASAIRALGSEALTMRLLTNKTSIPIPAVHAFDTSMQNPLGCPYILMDFVDGRPLYERWFNSTHEGDLEAFRTRTLETLAASMAQLTFFIYNRSGSLSSDAQGNFRGLGPARIYDAATMHNNLYDEEASDEAPFCDIGPFYNLRDYLLHMIKGHRPPIEGFGTGINRMLALFIKWLPEHHVNAPFGLAHPDYDLQNVLVKEDGTVCGLIDWDGVAAVPRSIGCESYPKWLTHDWDPFFYDFDIESRKLHHECGPAEHSPEELVHYRAMYAKFMEKALSGQQHKETRSTTTGSRCPHPDFCSYSEVTQKSLLIGSLHAAAWNPLSTGEIIVKIFDDIAKMTAHKDYNSASAGFIDDKVVLGSGKDPTNPVQEVMTTGSAENGVFVSEDNDLRELAWVLRYNDTVDGADMDGTQSPIGIRKEDHQPQNNASATYPHGVSGHTRSKDRNSLWTRRQWSKIGSFVHKASARLQSDSRARGTPSPAHCFAVQRPEIKPSGTNHSTSSPSSRTSSSGPALSLATTDMNSQVTKLTDVSSQAEQVTMATTNRDGSKKNAATIAAPRTTASQKYTFIGPRVKIGSDTQEAADGPCHTSTTDDLPDIPTSSQALIEHSPDTRLRGGKGSSSKPCQFIKAPYRLARRAIAKLRGCGRKGTMTKTKDLSTNVTSDAEERPAHPIGFSTHKERMGALKKAATQKCPGGEAQGCAPNESQPPPEPVVEESKSTTNTKAPPKAPATRNPTRAEEDDIGFMAASVCYALADGTLSEARMRRLKDGFHMLLESL